MSKRRGNACLERTRLDKLVVPLGAIAQLVERFHGMEEVWSSILHSSTQVSPGQGPAGRPPWFSEKLAVSKLVSSVFQVCCERKFRAKACWDGQSDLA